MKSTRLTNRPFQEHIPAWCIFVDTETKSQLLENGNESLSLLLGCFEVWIVDDGGLPISLERKGTFYTTDDFYELVKSYLPSRVIAHNWVFDAAVLKLGSRFNMMRHGYNISVNDSIIPVDSKGFSPFLISLDFDGRLSEFICNTNFYKQSLASLGDSFTTNKQVMPREEEYMDDVDYLEALEEYCYRDVEILRTAWFYMFEFVDDIAGITPGVTIAMAANRVYRKRFMPDVNIQGSLSIPKVTIAELEAYKGGRTDSFFSGIPDVENIYKYDVNSLYPSVMIGDMPIRYQQMVSEDMLRTQLQGGDTRFIYLSRVDINTDSESDLSFIASEGIRDSNDRLIFPVGRFTAWVWQPMLEILFEQDYIECIHEIYAYEKYPIFDDYVNTLYSERKKYKISGDKSKDLLLKIMLNSLYGKFGQRSHSKWHQIDVDDYEYLIMKRDYEGVERFSDFYNEDFNDYLSVGQDLFRAITTAELPNKASVLSVAGYITSKARSILWRGMATILERGGEVYYCDTDSIFTSIPLPDDMVSDNDLGYWKLEDILKGSDTEFVAPKHYRSRDTWKIKGIRNPSSDSKFNENVFPNFVTDLTSNNDKRRKRLELDPIIAKIVKRPTGINSKRLYRGDNMPTLPIILGD